MEILLSSLGASGVLLVLVYCVPRIIKGVEWVFKMIKRHKASQNQAYNEGYAEALEDQAIEERFEKGEAYMHNLGAREDKLETLLLKHEVLLDSLVAASNLDIKRTIKRTWDKVVQQRRPIDTYELSLLEDSYKLYAARGGNSWAKGMMEDIRRCATTTSAAPIDKEDTN